MIEEKELKKKITEKFGSLTRFAKTANIQAVDLLYMFRLRDDFVKQQKLNQINRLCDQIEPKPMDYDWIDGLGMRVKKTIKFQFDTIYNFCDQYPEFSPSWISLVVHDKRHTITNKIRRLFDVLNFDVESEKENLYVKSK
jgi:hypothetical protein